MPEGWSRKSIHARESSRNPARLALRGFGVGVASAAARAPTCCTGSSQDHLLSGDKSSQASLGAPKRHKMHTKRRQHKPNRTVATRTRMGTVTPSCGARRMPRLQNGLPQTVFLQAAYTPRTISVRRAPNNKFIVRAGEAGRGISPGDSEKEPGPHMTGPERDMADKPGRHHLFRKRFAASRLCKMDERLIHFPRRGQRGTETKRQTTSCSS